MMNTQELSEVVQALHHLVIVQGGELEALSVITDCILGDVGLHAPSIVPQLLESLDGVADLRRPDLDPEQILGFNNAITNAQSILSAVARR